MQMKNGDVHSRTSIWTYHQQNGVTYCLGFYVLVNSLAPGTLEWNFRYVIIQGILVIGSWGISCEIALIYESQLTLTDNESTLVQVMAWCRQAPSHYLGQCWPRSLTPHDVTRPQSVLITYFNSHKAWWIQCSAFCQWCVGCNGAVADVSDMAVEMGFWKICQHSTTINNLWPCQ